MTGSERAEIARRQQRHGQRRCKEKQIGMNTYQYGCAARNVLEARHDPLLRTWFRPRGILPARNGGVLRESWRKSGLERCQCAAMKSFSRASPSSISAVARAEENRSVPAPPDGSKSSPGAPAAAGRSRISAAKARLSSVR